MKTAAPLAVCFSVLFFPLESFLTFNMNLLCCDLNLLPLDLSTAEQALLQMKKLHVVQSLWSAFPRLFVVLYLL